MSARGKSSSAAKVKAARKNGKSGGRPINPMSVRQRQLRGEL